MTKFIGALGGAILIGLSGFLPVWTTTDETKTLVVAFAGPGVAYLMAYYRVTRPGNSPT